jgi:undecaprenyl-diphosphatase
VASLLEADVRTSERIRRVAERAGATRPAALIAHSADWWWWLTGAVVVWLAGDADTRSAALTVVSTITVTAIAVQSVKWIVRRQRPSGPRDFLSRHTDPHSFPSGHAARASALMVLAIVLGPWWLALALGAWATLVAAVRVAMGVHYLSDVVIGAALGMVCGLVVATRVAGGVA